MSTPKQLNTCSSMRGAHNIDFHIARRALDIDPQHRPQHRATCARRRSRCEGPTSNIHCATCERCRGRCCGPAPHIDHNNMRRAHDVVRLTTSTTTLCTRCTLWSSMCGAGPQLRPQHCAYARRCRGPCCGPALNIDHDTVRCAPDVLVDVPGRPTVYILLFVLKSILFYLCIEFHICYLRNGIHSFFTYLLKCTLFYLGIEINIALFMDWNPHCFAHVLKSILYYLYIEIDIVLEMHWTPHCFTFVPISISFIYVLKFTVIYPCIGIRILSLMDRNPYYSIYAETRIVLSMYWNPYHLTCNGNHIILYMYWNPHCLVVAIMGPTHNIDHDIVRHAHDVGVDVAGAGPQHRRRHRVHAMRCCSRCAGQAHVVLLMYWNPYYSMKVLNRTLLYLCNEFLIVSHMYWNP